MSKPEILWVDIPGGSFEMGSPDTEPERFDNETRHRVTLSAFRMSKHAITFEQYDAFCDEMGLKKPFDEGWGRGNRPVINVNWDDANNFALWMDCRLPTEAEWEYASRAGTTTAFNTGSNLTTDQANYDGIYLCRHTNGEYRKKTIPVGSFAPNAWGLYDMHGNVWEWCSDWFGHYPASGQKDPKGPESGSDRLHRGGSWYSLERYCRCAYRSKYSPGLRSDSIGFRLVTT